MTEPGDQDQAAIVMPFYIICDTSGSMRSNMEALNQALDELVLQIARDPVVDDTVMLSIITFDNDATVRVPLSFPSEITLPSLEAHGYTYYGAALGAYAKAVASDYARLKEQGFRFFRPCVFFLTDGLPVDNWWPTFDEVIHYDPKTKQGNRMYPYIVSYGFGEAEAEVLSQLAYPNFGPNQGQAFLARHASVQRLLNSIADSIGRSVVSSGMSGVGNGTPAVTIPRATEGYDTIAPASDAARAAGQAKTDHQPASRIYTEWAGVNQIKAARADEHGNAAGTEYDLIRDGSLDGAKIVVLNLCPREVNVIKPRAALEEKGFRVVEIHDGGQLRSELRDAAEFWIISDLRPHLSSDQIDEIIAFFNRGRGLYIWGDNEPFYADANNLLQRLFQTTMSGNSPGQQVVTLRQEGLRSGLVPSHPITTGLVNVYEGYTIAEVHDTEDLRPLIYGSNGKVVTTFFDRGGCRALVDGGFTRLYESWESTAGTARYVVNAAAWLLNLERFGEDQFVSHREPRGM